MRNRRVQLLDMGLDASFDASMSFAQATLHNIKAGYEYPVVDIDFVRTRDPGTVVAASAGEVELRELLTDVRHKRQ